MVQFRPNCRRRTRRRAGLPFHDLEHTVHVADGAVKWRCVWRLVLEAYADPSPPCIGSWARTVPFTSRPNQTPGAISISRSTATKWYCRKVRPSGRLDTTPPSKRLANAVGSKPPGWMSRTGPVPPAPWICGTSTRGLSAWEAWVPMPRAAPPRAAAPSAAPPLRTALRLIPPGRNGSGRGSGAGSWDSVVIISLG